MCPFHFRCVYTKGTVVGDFILHGTHWSGACAHSYLTMRCNGIKGRAASDSLHFLLTGCDGYWSFLFCYCNFPSYTLVYNSYSLIVNSFSVNIVLIVGFLYWSTFFVLFDFCSLGTCTHYQGMLFKPCDACKEADAS